MSRLAGSAVGSAPSTLMRGNDEVDDICPVCKSSRYLNPNMRFLVNPECYHKMCESCVDRIFSHGPAQCPVAGCRHTLRKHRFRKQTFADIQVEREVDIRGEIAKVFNRREDEFESLLDYNNYLEDVETITFGLINNIDLAENRAKLDAYRDANARSISRNAILASDEKATAAARDAADRERARLRRAAAAREESDERRERDEGRRDVLDRLTAGQASDAASIARDGERVMLKRASQRRAAADAERAGGVEHAAAVVTNGSAGEAAPGAGFTIRGLKRRIDPTPDAPYDAFGGLSHAPTYHVLMERYEWDWLAEARTKPQIVAGGYDVREYCRRALCDAFAGFGVDVAEEVGARDGGSRAVGTLGAAAVGGERVMTDVF